MGQTKRQADVLHILLFEESWQLDSVFRPLQVQEIA
jgi:hypothetical protein